MWLSQTCLVYRLSLVFSNNLNVGYCTVSRFCFYWWTNNNFNNVCFLKGFQTFQFVMKLILYMNSGLNCFLPAKPHCCFCIFMMCFMIFLLKHSLKFCKKSWINALRLSFFRFLLNYVAGFPFEVMCVHCTHFLTVNPVGTVEFSVIIIWLCLAKKISLWIIILHSIWLLRAC